MARKRTYKILLSDEDKKILNATINKKNMQNDDPALPNIIRT